MDAHAEAARPARPFLSALLYGACLLFAVALPLATLYTVIFAPAMVLHELKLPSLPKVENFTLLQRLGMATVALLPPLLQGYGFYRARSCFRSFMRGEYFTPQVVRGLRGFAAAMFFSIVAGLFATPLLSLIATAYPPPGEQHTLHLGISSQQVLALLFAGIFWQIAGVMTKAVGIAEENSQFV